MVLYLYKTVLYPNCYTYTTPFIYTRVLDGPLWTWQIYPMQCCVNEYDYNSDARLVRSCTVKAHQNFRNICAYQTLFAMLYHQIIVVKCHNSLPPSRKVYASRMYTFLYVIAKRIILLLGVLNRNNSMSD